MSMEKIRILVVDDHPLIGEGLEFFLNLDPGLLVMGVARNGSQGLELLKKLSPDLVILDISMPQLDGFEAIRLFLEAKPKLRILVYSGHTEDKYVHQALRAGARGYVVKGSSFEDLKRAIHYIWEGGYWVSPQFGQGLIKGYLDPQAAEDPAQAAFDSLSAREQQVFRLMVAGQETEEIAALLGISATTVAKHRIAMMRKLAVKNIVELLKFAIRNGLAEA
jgi:DNA-binding NarL/FixJ family response regulator